MSPFVGLIHVTIGGSCTFLLHAPVKPVLLCHSHKHDNTYSRVACTGMPLFFVCCVLFCFLSMLSLRLDGAGRTCWQLHLFFTQLCNLACSQTSPGLLLWVVDLGISRLSVLVFFTFSTQGGMSALGLATCGVVLSFHQAGLFICFPALLLSCTRWHPPCRTRPFLKCSLLRVIVRPVFLRGCVEVCVSR